MPLSTEKNLLETDISPLPSSPSSKQKWTVLFVDDEKNWLYGFQRAYDGPRPEYKILLAESGSDALEKLKKQPVDAIVADLCMPKLDGAELMQKVADLYPKTIRIIVTEHADQEKVLRSLKATHQIVHKPCDYELLQLMIDRACYLRDVVQNDSLKEFVTNLGELPSLPEIYVQLEKEIQSPHCSVQRIGEIVAQDAPMTAKILKFTNSAFFGLRFPVTSTKEAAVFLGLDNLKALVLAAQLFSKVKADFSIAEYGLEEMWNHNLSVASLARAIAQKESTDLKVAKDAFVSGILHDIGKLVLLQAPELYAAVKPLADKKNLAWRDAEHAILATTHAEVGAYLLALWGLPDEIVATVAFHHDPSRLGGSQFEAITAVHVANALLHPLPTKGDPLRNPYLDLRYLQDINQLGSLPHWIELAKPLQTGSANTKK